MRAVKACSPKHNVSIIETHVAFSSGVKNESKTGIASNNDLASKGFLFA